jgi:5-methyltetrahydrofolate--homocysteine methyltransferase
MAESILELAKERVVLLDGGLGTELIKNGFTPGACPESWNLGNPEVIKSIHSAYYAAGADAVTTNSFGGSQIKLSSYGQEENCYELNKAAAELIQEVKPAGKFVAASMGPTGKFLKPVGEYEEEQFVESYREQARGLADGGVDFFLLETQYDLVETRCCVQGIRQVSDKPVYATMTFNKTPRGFFTIMGIDFPKFVAEMSELDVLAVGANCTIDSKDMAEFVVSMRETTDLPIIVQANSGLPEMQKNGSVTYSQLLEEYVRYLPQIVKNGANLVGGCCGTDPDYISAMRKILDGIS